MEIPKVQEILEKQVLTIVKAVKNKIDDEIAALDCLDSDDLEAIKEWRLQQMKKMAEKQSHWIDLGHGEYFKISVENDFFAIVKASESVVCRRIGPVMDKHLSALAKRHIETHFVKFHAEKSPFLAERLKIVVLPTLALIKNTKVDDFLLGRTDEFATEDLEERLTKAQVTFSDGESSLHASRYGTQTKRSVQQSSNADSSDSD